MILDRALEKTLILPRDLRKLLLNEKPITHRYVFNQDASHKTGRFVATCPDIICREIGANMVSTPFPNTYIEIDNIASMDGAGVKTDSDCAPRLGYWIISGDMCFTVYGDEKDAEFSPFLFLPTHAVGIGRLREFYSNEQDKIQYFILKTLLMLGHIGDGFDYDKLSAMITSNMEVKFVTDILGKYDEHNEKKQKLFDHFIRENVGTYKHTVASLMMLDDRSQRKTVSVQATRKIVSGKLRAYAAHDVITIDLDVPSIRHAYTNSIGHHATPIEHEVAGHWVHYDCSSQCQHKWEPLRSEHAETLDIRNHGEVLPRFICSLCGGRKTRKLPYVKGDPSKGSRVGQARYKVIASKEKSILWKPVTPDDPE